MEINTGDYIGLASQSMQISTVAYIEYICLYEETKKIRAAGKVLYSFIFQVVISIRPQTGNEIINLKLTLRSSDPVAMNLEQGLYARPTV